MKLRKYYNIKTCFVLCTIISGSFSTLLSYTLETENFYYPIIITGLMFIGEALCGIIILIEKQCKKSKKIKESKDFSKVKNFYQKIGKNGCSLAAVFDLLGSLLEYYSYLALTPALIISLKTFSVFYVLLYRKCFMRKALYKHQKLGVLIFMIGIIFAVITVNLSSNNKFQVKSKTWVYIGFMVFSQFFAAVNFIVMENTMIYGHVTPDQMNFFKGIIGLLICGLIYVPACYVCVEGLECNNFLKPFERINGWWMVFYFVSNIFVLFIHNYFVVQTLRLTESLAVCTINSGRLFVIWIIFFVFSYNTFDESKGIELVSGLTIVTGLLIYNGILIIPCCGLKKSAQKCVRENYIFQKDMQEAREWQHRLDDLILSESVKK